MEADNGKPALRAATEFVAQRWRLVLGVSAAVLVPCFWHRHLEAGDLGSHVYNAWLAGRIERGELPGLWIARQLHNVEFDWLLSGLGRAFGLGLGAKIAAALCVLVFFWGTFALSSAAARSAAVGAMPLIGMAAYGWTFSDGFLNTQLAVGWSLFALAILWRGKGWERAVALLFAPLIWLADPVAIVWLIGAGAFVLASERASRRFQIVLFVAAIGLIVGADAYARRHFVLYHRRHAPYMYNGIDQFDLFTPGYKLLAIALLGFIVVVLLLEGAQRWHDDPSFRRAGGVLLLLYVVVEVLVFVLPAAIRLPGYGAPFGFLAERVTLVSAVLLCCLMGLPRPRAWRITCLAAVALVFFAWMYRDTGVLNDMAEQTAALIEPLVPGQRVLFTISNRGSRVLVGHFVDEACVGHCFSYGNYEASTGQYRVRAAPGNPFVMADFGATERMEDGIYEVQESELPAYQIYQCDATGRKLCIRELSAGEENNRGAVFRGSPFQR